MEMPQRYFQAGRDQRSTMHQSTHQLTKSPTHQLTNTPTHQLTNSHTHHLTNSPTHELTDSPPHAVPSPWARADRRAAEWAPRRGTAVRSPWMAAVPARPRARRGASTDLSRAPAPARAPPPSRTRRRAHPG